MSAPNIVDWVDARFAELNVAIHTEITRRVASGEKVFAIHQRRGFSNYCRRGCVLCNERERPRHGLINFSLASESGKDEIGVCEPCVEKFDPSTYMAYRWRLVRLALDLARDEIAAANDRERLTALAVGALTAAGTKPEDPAEFYQAINEVNYTLYGESGAPNRTDVAETDEAF